ncbi:Magnetosome protein MamB [Caballeronia sp. SBC1]|uniref:cation diffusion facilitator family transporter n=1 Tax=unclassified Caballeronia TaxID=2646786 RepID=UPI0013E1BFD5|nr:MULTISPECIES: cation diffusion facilitator family transporter [unclassified Caballeronia]QIE24144.1 Magnetosome protein MamB [Caballeronia sp. SBC2]QIN62040.1 Magnetosome protein MamB [Caballeronia sp. SBC1]
MSSTSEHGREKHHAAFKAAQVSVLLNAALMTMQIVIGWLAYSDGLLADGVHTLADLAADGMVLAVLRLSATAVRRSANDQYDRVETIGSLLISILLIATGMETLWSSLGHAANAANAANASSVHASALVVAVFVIVAKEALFRYIMAVAKRTRSTLLVASAWHARSDAISALIAAVGILGSMAGLAISDRLAAAVIGIMIARIGVNLGLKAVKDSFSRPASETAGQ